MKRKILILSGLILWSLCVFSKDLDVGVIFDNNSNFSQNIKELLQKELDKDFSKTGYIPKISKVNYLGKNNLEQVLKEMSRDKELDSIFVFSSSKLGSYKELNKNKLYFFPLNFEKSQKAVPKNVSYIYGELNLDKGIKIIKEIPGVSEINIAVSNLSDSDMKKVGEKYQNSSVRINIQKATREFLEESERENIPTLLADYENSLDKYAFMGYNMNDELGKRIKASVLNYIYFKTGDGISKIEKITSPEGELFYNEEVGIQIGYSLPLSVMQEVSVINKKKVELKKLDLKSAVEIGLKNNLEILKKNQDLTTSKYDVNVSNSYRLPQLSANIDGTFLDKKSNDVVFNKAQQNSAKSYLQLSQVIYSEQLNTNVYLSKLAMESKRSDLEQQKLDIIYYISSTYLNILQLNAQLKIQESNYDLLKESLKIANINYKVGAGGVQDIYRLESSVSEAYSNIVSVKNQIRQSTIQLNTYLDLPKNQQYAFEELENISRYFVFNRNFSSFFVNSEKNDAIEQFLFEGALKNSNNLNIIENEIKGKKREYSSAGRERIIPKIEAFAQYNKDNMIEPWGKNRNYPPNGEDEYWQAGVKITLPLISGGEIHYKRKSLQSEIDSLNYTKKITESQLSQAVSQSFNEFLTNYIQTYTSKQAAEAAEKNMKIVKNLYSNGSINITDFLDAQNNALSQRLENTIKNYSLLNSILKLENLYGKSSLTMEQNEKEQLRNQLSSILKEYK